MHTTSDDIASLVKLMRSIRMREKAIMTLATRFVPALPAFLRDGPPRPSRGGSKPLTATTLECAHGLGRVLKMAIAPLGGYFANGPTGLDAFFRHPKINAPVVNMTGYWASSYLYHAKEKQGLEEFWYEFKAYLGNNWPHSLTQYLTTVLVGYETYLTFVQDALKMGPKPNWASLDSLPVHERSELMLEIRAVHQIAIQSETPSAYQPHEYGFAFTGLILRGASSFRNKEDVLARIYTLDKTMNRFSQAMDTAMATYRKG